MICKGFGMFSIGNINPLSVTVGRNIPVNQINIAVCWESVDGEISNPSVSEVMIKRMHSRISSNKLPCIGTPSTNLLSNKILAILTNDNNRYGTAFATMIFKGCSGDTSMISIVPVSFSFTIVTAVIIVQINISTMAITPGTKL